MGRGGTRVRLKGSLGRAGQGRAQRREGYVKQQEEEPKMGPRERREYQSETAQLTGGGGGGEGTAMGLGGMETM